LANSTHSAFFISNSKLRAAACRDARGFAGFFASYGKLGLLAVPDGVPFFYAVNFKLATAVLLALATLTLIWLVAQPGASQPAEAVREQSPPASAARSEASLDSGATQTGGSVSNRVSRRPNTAPAGVETNENFLVRLAGLKDPRQREAAIDELFRQLASMGPEAALARAAELPDAESRDMAMLALLGEYSGLSTLEIIKQGSIWMFGAQGALASHLLESGRISPQQAAEMAKASVDGNRRGELFAEVASKLAATDPTAALALGNDLEGRQRRRFLEQFSRSWAEASPTEARQWAAQIADQSTRDAMLAGITQAEIQRSPALAAQNFSAMPPTDAEARAATARRIASSWASNDTVAAMNWAAGLTAESDRAAAQQGISGTAPVGIGAMLNRGENGLPVVGDLVPGGPASASGALKAGDALMAVTDANGAWVDTRSLRMGDLLGMIRGQPNTQVSLQVQSPGSGAPRVITLGRQQVIFRPKP